MITNLNNISNQNKSNSKGLKLQINSNINAATTTVTSNNANHDYNHVDNLSSASTSNDSENDDGLPAYSMTNYHSAFDLNLLDSNTTPCSPPPSYYKNNSTTNGNKTHSSYLISLFSKKPNLISNSNHTNNENNANLVEHSDLAVKTINNIIYCKEPVVNTDPTVLYNFIMMYSRAPKLLIDVEGYNTKRLGLTTNYDYCQGDINKDGMMNSLLKVNELQFRFTINASSMVDNTNKILSLSNNNNEDHYGADFEQIYSKLVKYTQIDASQKKQINITPMLQYDLDNLVNQVRSLIQQKFSGDVINVKIRTLNKQLMVQGKPINSNSNIVNEYCNSIKNLFKNNTSKNLLKLSANYLLKDEPKDWLYLHKAQIFSAIEKRIM